MVTTKQRRDRRYRRTVRQLTRDVAELRVLLRDVADVADQASSDLTLLETTVDALDSRVIDLED